MAVNTQSTDCAGGLTPGASIAADRSKTQDAVQVQDVTMFLPQPEFDFLADRAAASSSFVVQLMGECALGAAARLLFLLRVPACRRRHRGAGVARGSATSQHSCQGAQHGLCRDARTWQSVRLCKRCSAVQIQSCTMEAAAQASLWGTCTEVDCVRVCVC